MNQQLEERLTTLEAEFQAGRKLLAELEARESALRTNLLRISGAIQVLREFLPQSNPIQPGGVPAEAGKDFVAAN